MSRALELLKILFRQRRLRRRQPGDRHPEWTAAHIVQADLVTELHRVWVAALLAADADLQIRSRRPALLDAYLHERADAVGVDGLEGIAGDDIVLHVVADEAA